MVRLWPARRLGVIAVIGMAIFAVLALARSRVAPAGASTPSAQMERVTVTQGVDLQRYLGMLAMLPPTGVPCVEMAASGALVEPTILLTDLRGKYCQVKWTLFSRDESRPVPATWYPYGREFDYPIYTPGSVREEWTTNSWIPYPHVQGAYFARLEVLAELDGSIASLGYADTEAFTVGAARGCGAPASDEAPAVVETPEWVAPP
jgi:hypothetical protein